MSYHRLTEKLLDVFVDVDSTGKEYSYIKSPQKVLKELTPISYKSGGMGIHQDSRDTVPEEYIMKKKGATYIRADYMMVMVIDCVKKLDERVSTLEKMNKAPYKT